MDFHPRKFSFSADVKTQAVYQIDFLEAVDRLPDLKKPHILARSVYRYEKYWLPLAASHPNECLSAPLDIEWVWHCHMLSPRAYSKDCVTIVNVVINHKLRSKQDYLRALIKSCELWERRWGAEEPFYLKLDLPYDKRETKITYNIIDAASRQKAFYYQVSLPHHRDPKYLDVGILRYKKFLYLKQQLPEEFIVPCYDIDLIWHTHQLNPWAYWKDMMTYIGNLFNHDDNVTDRSEGSKLYNADMMTRYYWKRVFNEGFSMFGAMYRGPPPDGVLYQITPDDTYEYSTKQTTVRLEDMSLQCHGGRALQNFKLNIIKRSDIQRSGSKQGLTCRIAKFKKPSGSVDVHSDIVWSKEEVAKKATFGFNTGQYNNILIHLQKSEGCLGSNERIGETSYYILPEVEKPSAKSGGTIDIKGESQHQYYDKPCYYIEQKKEASHVFPHALQQKIHTIQISLGIYLLCDRYHATRCTNWFLISTNYRRVSPIKLNERNHIENAKCECANRLILLGRLRDTTTNPIHFEHDQILKTVSRKNRLNFLRLKCCLPCN